MKALISDDQSFVCRPKLSEDKTRSSRRDFLKVAGGFAAGAVVAGATVAAIQPAMEPAVTKTPTETPTTAVPVTVGDISALRSALEWDGFIVQEGEFSHQDAIALLNAGVTKDATGANVGAPYLAYKIPPAPEQSAPNPLADDRGWSYTYRLRPDEALILVGRTPPEVAYFSYQSYLIFRFFPNTKKYGRLYDGIGDSINLLTINTAGTPNGSPGNRSINHSSSSPQLTGDQTLGFELRPNRPVTPQPS
jgi:hypothetical protein